MLCSFNICFSSIFHILAYIAHKHTHCSRIGLQQNFLSKILKYIFGTKKMSRDHFLKEPQHTEQKINPFIIDESKNIWLHFTVYIIDDEKVIFFSLYDWGSFKICALMSKFSARFTDFKGWRPTDSTLPSFQFLAIPVMLKGPHQGSFFATMVIKQNSLTETFCLKNPNFNGSNDFFSMFIQ